MKQIEILFKDGSVSITFNNVQNFFNEGGLLRIVLSDNKNLWYPVNNIFRIKEV